MREHVDLPRLEALEREWKRHPPVHHLVAAYLGYKPPASAGAKQGLDVSEDITPLLGEAGGLPIRTDAPKVDTSAWDALMAQKGESSNG